VIRDIFQAIAVLALGIYRGGIFQPGAPQAVSGNYDFIFYFAAALIGVCLVTWTYILGYFLGHTPSRQVISRDALICYRPAKIYEDIYENRNLVLDFKTIETKW
jgi:hypothetical protein